MKKYRLIPLVALGMALGLQSEVYAKQKKVKESIKEEQIVSYNKKNFEKVLLGYYKKNVSDGIKQRVPYIKVTDIKEIEKDLVFVEFYTDDYIRHSNNKKQEMYYEGFLCEKKKNSWEANEIMCGVKAGKFKTDLSLDFLADILEEYKTKNNSYPSNLPEIKSQFYTNFFTRFINPVDEVKKEYAERLENILRKHITPNLTKQIVGEGLNSCDFPLFAFESYSLSGELEENFGYKSDGNSYILVSLKYPSYRKSKDLNNHLDLLLKKYLIEMNIIPEDPDLVKEIKKEFKLKK